MSVFCTYPLEVIRVRMAFQTRFRDKSGVPLHPSFLGAARQIYHEGANLSSIRSPQKTPVNLSLPRFPLLKFYRGFTVTVMGMIPYSGVSFLSWGFLRSYFLPPSKVGHKTPTHFADLAIGATSGVIGQTVSYPFEVIRRRMQVGGITQPDRWLRWGETILTIWKASGWRGFYVGLTIGYLKVVPMTAVSFAVWQSGKRLLNV
jgi:solute carrier family 25 protein 16